MSGDPYGRFGHDEDEDHDGPGGRHHAPPEDKNNLIYLAMVCSGVGFLLPYNSFTVAVDYWEERYPGSSIVFDISIVYIMFAFGAVLLNNLLVEAIPLNLRILFGYVVALITLFFVSFFEIWWPTTFPPEVSYSITLFSVAVVAFGCTVQQASFYGYTSMLPKRYTQAVMTGESTAGLIISTNRIITKLLLDDPRINTMIFFVLAIGFVSLCLVTHIIVQKSDFVLFYINLCRSAEDNDDMKRITLEPQVKMAVCMAEAYKCSSQPIICNNSWKEKTFHFTLEDNNLRRASENGIGGSYGGTFSNSDSTSTIQSASTYPVSASVDPTESGSPNYRVEHVVMNRVIHRGYTSSYTKSIRCWTGIKRGIKARWEVSRNVWHYMLTIALAYFVTLCLYPGIESEISSCRLGSWMPVIMMAIFNLFDFIGKVLASLPYDWTRRQLIWGSSFRVFIIPLMMLCAVPRLNPLIPGEAIPMLTSALLGITNGIVGSVPMILAPTKVADEHRELTGNIMTLSYNIGLILGASVAFGLDDILGPPLEHPCGNETVTALRLGAGRTARSTMHQLMGLSQGNPLWQHQH